MNIIGAYKIFDRQTGLFYIGSSMDVNNRFKEHIQTLNRNYHQNLNLQNLWNRGCDLELEIFPTETREEAYDLEQNLININKDSSLLLNIGLGVFGGDNITLHPNRDKIISKIKDTLNTTISNLSTEERILTYSRKDSNNGMYGKTHSPESRKLISEALTGRTFVSTRIFTDEERKNLSELAKCRTGELNPFYGKQHSLETRKKISDTNKAKGIIPTNARKVIIDTVVYESVTEAARQLKVSPALIIYRITSIKEKYNAYCYLD